jgi:prophage maintenance system killer protein
MEDLTFEQVVAIHSRIIEEYKGDCRLLAEANLHEMIFHANIIPACVPRAAFIFWYLCAYPSFREGNSETAFVMAAWVLACGGYRITGEKAGIMALADGIPAFTTEPEEIEQWLCDNIRKSVSQQPSFCWMDPH